ncbi:MAG: hypothetical protein DLM72_12905 [Candidatus Nitrosopolaris wilkensis]|nr:MAG: hypothetical protein DLM72_12905 [Candidatus Nitrosopolaris wilkensis]
MFRSPRLIHINYVIVSEREQESPFLNPFLDPLEFWQRYFIIGFKRTEDFMRTQAGTTGFDIGSKHFRSLG